MLIVELSNIFNNERGERGERGERRDMSREKTFSRVKNKILSLDSSPYSLRPRRSYHSISALTTLDNFCVSL